MSLARADATQLGSPNDCCGKERCVVIRRLVVPLQSPCDATGWREGVNCNGLVGLQSDNETLEERKNKTREMSSHIEAVQLRLRPLEDFP